MASVLKRLAPPKATLLPLIGVLSVLLLLLAPVDLHDNVALSGEQMAATAQHISVQPHPLHDHRECGGVLVCVPVLLGVSQTWARAECHPHRAQPPEDWVAEAWSPALIPPVPIEGARLG